MWLCLSAPPTCECLCCRQREATRDATEQGDDPDDEFDDEETFLNLDDVLEGEPTPYNPPVPGPPQLKAHPQTWPSPPHALIFLHQQRTITAL